MVPSGVVMDERPVHQPVGGREAPTSLEPRGE